MSRQKQRVIPNGVQTNGTDGIDAKALASLPLEDIKKRLGFAADGLADEEAKARLTRFGPNELAEEKTNPILKFLSYF